MQTECAAAALFWKQSQAPFDPNIEISDQFEENAIPQIHKSCKFLLV